MCPHLRERETPLLLRRPCVERVDPAVAHRVSRGRAAFENQRQVRQRFLFDRAQGGAARELEVAVLVGQGKTNPQIASELFLSGKTVESHVRSAFRELELTSRLELARLMDRVRERRLDRPAWVR